MWNPYNPTPCNIDDIRRVIKNRKDKSVVRLGGMTDCFQSAERDYGVTYETIKALNDAGIPYLIVTKSDMVAEDRYLDILDKKLAHVQVTVTNTDDSRAREYENAPSTSRRLTAIKTLQECGIDTQIRLSLYIEGYIDFDAINNYGIESAVVEFLRVNSWIRKWFDIDYSKHTLKSGNYRHLQLDEKIRQLENIDVFKEVTVCEDVDSHYFYWRKNYNPNPDDCCNLKI